MLKYLSLFPTVILLVIFSLTLQSCSTTKVSKKSYTIPLHEAHASPFPTAVEPEEIKLAAGDILMISVWGQDALTKEVTLDAMGNIYYPFIGKIKASGQTIAEVQAEMKEKLSRYYTTPELTVIPQNLAGQQYYILGEVSKPGNFRIKSQLNIISAISSAGGPNRNAGETVLLLRKQQDRLLVTGIPVQYTDVTTKNIPSLTMMVQAGDILYMPPSRIANIENFMSRLNSILAPILSIERGIIFWPQIIDALEGSSQEQQFVIPLQ
ncbi:MAG: polysaccharide biosynthesis/export family protein [Candidatus Electrothrix communis]|nr:MAG: polysaccharide biosynthesis/export family protein [Candidatus Electrothrix communis]